MANLEGANLTDALLMLSHMKGYNLINTYLTRTNFMYANLQGCNLTNSKMSKTIFVHANLRDAKLTDIDKSAIYLKYPRLGRIDDDDDGCCLSKVFYKIINIFWTKLRIQWAGSFVNYYKHQFAAQGIGRTFYIQIGLFLTS